MPVCSPACVLGARISPGVLSQSWGMKEGRCMGEVKRGVGPPSQEVAVAGLFPSTLLPVIWLALPFLGGPLTPGAPEPWAGKVPHQF